MIETSSEIRAIVSVCTWQHVIIHAVTERIHQVIVKMAHRGLKADPKDAK